LRFFVQAHRSGHNDPWVTDKSYPERSQAVAHAQTLFEQFGRAVRVVDDEDRVLMRLCDLAGRKR
jgi:hypothetical protein